LQLVGSNSVSGLGAAASYSGTLNVAGASLFQTLLVQNATASIVVTNPVGGGGPTFKLTLNDANWTSTNLECASIVANGSVVTDTAVLETTGTQQYIGCQISATKLKSLASAFPSLSFSNCEFLTAMSIATDGGEALFDGPSWASFQAAGGTVSSETTGTVVVVTGGFLQGTVQGVGIVNPAGGVATLAPNGVGATATWNKGGNWYTASALAVNTTITLADTATAGAPNGTTLCITRTDASGFSLTVSDAAAGPIATLPATGFAVFHSNGINWSLVQIG
jgi:hypothetical protein